MAELIRTETFDKGYLTLTEIERKQANKALRFLAENPRHPSLQTHKVAGTELIEAYANKDIRILFERTNDLIVLKAIGHHDILRKY